MGVVFGPSGTCTEVCRERLSERERRNADGGPVTLPQSCMLLLSSSAMQNVSLDFVFFPCVQRGGGNRSGNTSTQQSTNVSGRSSNTLSTKSGSGPTAGDVPGGESTREQSLMVSYGQGSSLLLSFHSLFSLCGSREMSIIHRILLRMLSIYVYTFVSSIPCCSGRVYVHFGHPHQHRTQQVSSNLVSFCLSLCRSRLLAQGDVPGIVVCLSMCISVYVHAPCLDICGVSFSLQPHLLAGSPKSACSSAAGSDL